MTATERLRALLDMVGTLRRGKRPNYCPNCGRMVVA